MEASIFFLQPVARQTNRTLVQDFQAGTPLDVSYLSS